MIRQILLGSVSVLAFAAPLAAQTAPDVQAQGSGLDTAVPADDATPTPAPGARTGDAVLDRLNELEAKVNALEARNKQLEADAADGSHRGICTSNQTLSRRLFVAGRPIDLPRQEQSRDPLGFETA